MGQSMIMIMVILGCVAAASCATMVILFLNRGRISRLFGGGDGNTDSKGVADGAAAAAAAAASAGAGAAAKPVDWVVPANFSADFWVSPCSADGATMPFDALKRFPVDGDKVTGTKPCCSGTKPNYTCNADVSYRMQTKQTSIFAPQKCTLNNGKWVFQGIKSSDAKVRTIPDGTPCTCEAIKKLYGSKVTCGDGIFVRQGWKQPVATGPAGTLPGAAKADWNSCNALFCTLKKNGSACCDANSATPCCPYRPKDAAKVGEFKRHDDGFCWFHASNGDIEKWNDNSYAVNTKCA